MLYNSTLRAARLLVVLVAAVGLLTLTPSANEAAHASGVTRTERVDHALRIALSKQGDPYVYGAAGPNAFDCSGLTSFAFHRAGFIHLPRTAAAQAGFVRHISRHHMRVGDFVFFTSGGHVYHVGVFDGWHHHRRIIVHSPRPGERVRREAIWTSLWFAGTLR